MSTGQEEVIAATLQRHAPKMTGCEAITLARWIIEDLEAAGWVVESAGYVDDLIANSADLAD